MAIALERFRRQSLRLCGLRGAPIKAGELAATIRRRFGNMDDSLEADLAACEEAAWGETVMPRDAYKMIVRLHHHMENLKEAARPRGAKQFQQTKQKERQS